MGMDFKKIDNFHIDVLREIGNIGSGNAATALAKMLNRKVDMKVPEVKILEFKDVSEILGGAENQVVGLLLGINGDINGDIMFLLGVKDAKILVNMLFGRSKDDRSNLAFDEMEVSALKEVGNILAGSYISALSTLTSLKLKPTVPELAIDMAGAILSVPAIEFGKVGDTVLFIETEFIEGEDRVSGNFFLIPDIESYDILMNALGVNS